METIASVFTGTNWSPYVVGIGIGLLSWLSFLISGKPIATSTSYAVTGGMIEEMITGEKARQSPYYRKIKLNINWQWMLVFGVGFATLGYCPGTIVGAIDNGYLDALTGGLAGILSGIWIFALMYPKLKDGILKKGDFGDITIPRLLKVNDWVVVTPAVGLIILLLLWIEKAGF